MKTLTFKFISSSIDTWYGPEVKSFELELEDEEAAFLEKLAEELGEVTEEDLEECNPELSEKISEEACSPEWLAWAEEEGVMDTENGQRYLVLHTLSVPGKSDVECFILSRSSDSFFCHVMEQSTAECQLQDIVRITKPVRNPALLTAVDDIIRVQTGMVYQGVITNQVFGSHYEIWNRSDNAVYTIRNDEVAAVGMKAFNPDYTLWQQTPYLQTIQTESQIFGPGFIIENTYATSRTPGTLTFLTKEGKN